MTPSPSFNPDVEAIAGADAKIKFYFIDANVDVAVWRYEQMRETDVIIKDFFPIQFPFARLGRRRLDIAA